MTTTLTATSFRRPVAAKDLTGLWSLWRQRRAVRMELARLVAVGPHLLTDVGLTYDEALAECGKPFWRA